MIVCPGPVSPKSGLDDNILVKNCARHRYGVENLGTASQR